MSQNCSTKNENRLLELTVSNDQLTQLHDSNKLEDNKNTIKKVTSLNTSRLETKHKSNTCQKTYKVKLSNYKKHQTAFSTAYNELKMSYESIKKFKKDSLSDNNISEFGELEELDYIIHNTLQDKFGKTFLKPEAPSKKDHAVFVFNRNKPLLCVDINSTTGYQNLDSSIEEAYKYVWNNYLAVSEKNMKYHFWLQNIIKPNEFFDLHSVREYLLQNMFNKEQTAEKLETKLNDFFNNLHLKFINIINDVDDINNPEKNAIRKNEHEELETNAENKLQMAIEEHKQKMDLKIKTLEIENENLKQKETECATQMRILLGELSFRNNKLNNVKDRVTLLTKEKNDLISMIQKMEIKDENYLTLKNKIAQEQKKNQNLRSILAEEYEKEDNSFLINEI
ncbi:hypothetical protein AGLY_008212 [Aphis glycines]|uniref:Uncharacterized protein n=1 Tax=Aphis glycines TaxID=307491 RepID=A0A6G0TNG4_APHGL|nr:hypothetical protein AGLY_008212 [Aphis glycines]